MRKSHALIAILASFVLLSAFSAQAAEGVQLVGTGVTRLMDPHKLEQQQSKLLVESSVIKGELEEPLGQSRRKDTTSAGISRSAAEPKKNSAERSAPETTTRATEKRDEPDSKFCIYHTIKESVLDFFLPSRRSAKKIDKVDLPKVHKDGRTEGKKPAAAAQSLR